MKYKDYESKIFNKESFKEQINFARSEAKIELGVFDESELYDGLWIPFNLERKYIDYLIERKEYEEAREILIRMKQSYTKGEFSNFIEIYEYRLNSIIHTNKNIEEEIVLAKREFNNHTILILSVIVGVITIFGTANNTLFSPNYLDGLSSFLAITASIILLICLAFYVNNKSKDRQ